MTDHLPGFSADETAKPPTKRELAARDKEYRALAAWIETQDEAKVRKLMRLGSNREARIIINRAAKRLEEEREDHLLRLRWMHDGLLSRMLMKLSEAFHEGDFARTRDLLATMERQAKLHGLDAQRDQDDGGPAINVIVTPPWMREPPGDVIDGEADGPPGLPSGG